MRTSLFVAGCVAVLLSLLSGGAAGKPQSPADSDGELTALADRLAAAPEAEREAGVEAAGPNAWPALLKLARERAAAAYDKQNYRGALPLYQISAAAAHRMNDTEQEVKAISNIGQTLDHLSEPKLALEAYDKGLALADETKLPAEVANLLTAKGVTLLEVGRGPEALAAHKRSQELFRQLGDQVGVARTTNNLGNVYLETGDFAAAGEQYQQCLQLSTALGQKKGIGFSLNNLGNLYYAQGDLERALDYHQRSLVVKKPLGNKGDIAKALLNIGLEQYQLGKYDLALKTMEQSLSLGREIGNSQTVANNLNNRSLVERDTGHLAEAVRDLEESLAIYRRNDMNAGASMSLENLSVLALKQGNAAEAYERAKEAVELARQAGASGALREGSASMGRALQALGRRQEAREAFLEAIRATETQGGRLLGGEAAEARYLGEKMAPYHSVARLLLEDGQVADAFRMEERAKARVLLEALRNGRVEITKAMTADERQRERTLSDRLSALSREMTAQYAPAPLKARWEQARKDLDRYQDSLYAAHPRLKAQRGETEPLTLEQAAQLFPNSQTVLLEYAQSVEGLTLYVLTKTGHSAPVLTAHAIHSRPAELTALITRFEERIASRDPGYRDDAALLYRLLLTPAQKEIAGKETLVIVPDGALWHLPFQALLSPRGKHLLEEQAVFYSTSLTVLWENVQGRKPAEPGSLTLLAMGNPEPEGAWGKGGSRGDAMPALPDAEREVRDLGELYGRDKSRAYTGADAREDRLKSEAGRFRLLHLATHGILNDVNPLYSYVLLARSKDGAEDGLLEAREMMQLDLRAQLVSLSACETAGGRLSGGEGLIGMSWALQVAGSPAVLVSQWKVDSASTADLMLAFYRQLQPRLRAGPFLTGKAAALRQASLSLLQDPRYRHPFYWSSFVLIGDGY